MTDDPEMVDWTPTYAFGPRDWQPMATAPTDGTVVNVVGRYPWASAGFPRYAACMNGQWVEYSSFEPQEIVCWAWRPRDEWPSEEWTMVQP